LTGATILGFLRGTPVSAFYMNEAVFDLPDAAFVDHTVTYLSGKSPGRAEVVLLLERRPLPPGQSLREAVDAHGRDVATRYFGYTVVFDREVEVASRPAIDVGARWRAAGGEAIFTRRVHLLLGSTRLVVTGEAPFAERDFCNTYVDHVLATLELRT
jgi:hypothetical protein